MSRRKKTVIGDLREVAERLAPGRACISVVSDHGFCKDWQAIKFIPGGLRCKFHRPGVLNSLSVG